jgi:hypothetical protein
MIKHIFLSLLLIGFNFSIQAEPVQKITDLTAAQEVVKDFNMLPNHLVFCAQTNFDLGDFNELKPILQTFFSAEFFKLFVWARCYLPNRTTEPDGYLWDFRYGLSMTESNYGDEIRVKNVKVLPAIALPKNRAQVKVTYNFYQAENEKLITTYTLIVEDGAWKIDDIALKGFVLNKGTDAEEVVLPVSKSLKKELLVDFEEAETKYKQEQDAKSKRK